MQISQWFVFILFLTMMASLGAISTPETLPRIPGEQHEFQPWFTGSLLAGAGCTVDPSHVNLEPYLFATAQTGVYNDHWKGLSENRSFTVTPLLFTSIGLLRNVDLSLIPRMYANFKEHASDIRIGDFPVFIGVQLMRDRREAWTPDLRMVIKSIFPTGHYQHLNPSLHGTDATGIGSYQAGFAFNFQKVFYLGINLLRMRLNFDYLMPSSVHVKGFNTYGGGYGTSGKVRPGNIFTSTLAFEYMFSQRWIGALDIQYVLEGPIRFSGKPGISLTGTPAIMTSPAAQQISLAPAIEYAFNGQIGLIAGPWFTIAGKNSARFISGVIALNYYH